MTKLEEILDGLLFMHCGNESNILLDYKDVTEAMKAYAEFCCEEQKKICADHAEANFEPMGWLADQHSICNFIEGEDYEVPVIRNSILQSPTYKEKDEE